MRKEYVFGCVWLKEVLYKYNSSYRKHFIDIVGIQDLNVKGKFWKNKNLK